MEPINGWNAIQEAGDFERVELGGHICTIIGARAESTKSGGKMLVIAFDFAQEDKQAGYYQSIFDADKKKDANAKWRNGGMIYQNYGTDKSNPFFKSLITNICKSNPGFQWAWDENDLKGKKFGGLFGREEYDDSKGNSKFSVKCMKVCPIESVMDLDIPQDKLLSKSNTVYRKDIDTGNFASAQTLDINADDLPF